MPVNITDTLHVTTTEGVLATADEIYDKSQRKFQSQINSEKLNVVIISYGYDESIDEDTFIDDMSVVLDSLERATSTDATLLMQRVSEFGNKTTYYGVVRSTGAGYEICWLFYEYPRFDNSIPALDAQFYNVFVEYNAQVKPKITTGSFLDVITAYEENPDEVPSLIAPVSYRVFYDQTINKQLKPAVEGSAGQVLTKTGPNPEDVKWVTPSGGGGGQGGLSEGAEQAIAESSNNLEQRIAALEKFIYAVVTGEAVIPKLQVKSLNAYDENSIVKRGAGAPTVPPDFAGQFYVDTETPAVYFAKANNKVSDWTNL